MRVVSLPFLATLRRLIPGRSRGAEALGGGTTRHSEIESKFEAGHVAFEDFEKWAEALQPVRREVASGQDDFFRKGGAIFRRHGNVVRHRVSDSNGLHELTTKILTSRKSTRERREVDVFVGSKPEDVEYLLKLLRFKKDVGIRKDHSMMFDVIDEGLKVDLCLYDAVGTSGKALKKGAQRYIEVEVEKSPDVSIDVATALVKKWEGIVQEQFGLGKPMNKSLYELFGGKGYRRERS